MEEREKIVRDMWDTFKTSSMHATVWRGETERERAKAIFEDVGNDWEFGKSDCLHTYHHVQKLTKMNHRSNVRTKTIKFTTLRILQ